MRPASFAPSPDSLPPTSARVSLSPRSGITNLLKLSAQTDTGRAREHNEDNFLIDRDLGLSVVCDGMGGHAAGDVASSLAVRAFRDVIADSRPLLTSYIGAGSGRAGANKRDVLQLLEHAASHASRVVHAEASRDEAKRGMGTTLVAAVVLGNHAFIVHVGDSRAYLLRRGSVEQLTRDHNVYNELIKRNKLGSDAARNAAPKHALTRAIGVYAHCMPETLVLDVTPGDRLLLCSDGLSRYFEPPEGQPGDLAAALDEPDDDRAVENLIAIANGRGGLDNITAALLTLGSVGHHDADLLERLQASRQTLACSPFFELLDEQELFRVLAVTEVVSYRPGQTIMKEGEPGEELLIVLSGHVNVSRGDAEVATLYPGEHIGEMSLIREQPRSARAVAGDHVEALVIQRDDLWALLRSDQGLGTKLLWRLACVLADRLDLTTDELRDSREQLAAPDLSHEVFYDDDDVRDTLRPPSFLPRPG